MTCFDARTPIGRWVAERPSRARVLGRLGIDYCCDVRVPLDRACASAGLDVDEVLRQLEDWSENEDEADHLGRSWPTIGALVDHIVTDHHDFLRRELPRLLDLASWVATAHGPRYPALRGVDNELGELWAELEPHLREEETELFPSLRRLDDPEAQGNGCKADLDGLIASLEREHNESAATLGRLRALTAEYAVPATACAAHRTLLAGLSALESDLRLHIHEENNLLLPRALTLAASPRHE